MNIYLLHQNKREGYDTYDSCVVVAESEEAARLINPDGWTRWDGSRWIDIRQHADYATSNWIDNANRRSWGIPDDVEVELVGVATPDSVAGRVICASFNAG